MNDKAYYINQDCTIDVSEASKDELNKVWEFLENDGFTWKSGDSIKEYNPHTTPNTIICHVSENRTITWSAEVFHFYDESINYLELIGFNGTEVDFGNEIFSIWEV